MLIATTISRRSCKPLVQIGDEMNNTEKIISWVAKQTDYNDASMRVALGEPGIWEEIIGHKPAPDVWMEYHKLVAKAIREAENEQRVRQH